MAMVNVNRNVTDQFYRYKMPRLIAKVEGSGNGIKTVISNMTEIGKSLNRPPTYPTKYFGCELGAQTQFDFKNERYIVNGSHDNTKLQELLDGFIKRFVLCPECDNPETNLKVKKNMIGQHCIACGYQGFLDMRHRLTQFILRSPPNIDPRATGNSKTKRKDRKDKNSHHNGDNSEELNTTWGDDDDDEEWSVDVSEDAVAERMKELTVGAKGLTLNNDLEKSQTERLQLFYDFVKKLKEEDQLKDMDKDIYGEADRLNVKDKGPLVLAEILLDENIIKQLKLYKNYFLRFTVENQKSQKYLLGGFELLCGNIHPDQLLPKVANILMMMYNLDLVDEEVFLEWGAKPSKKYVTKEVSQKIHEKAAPFLKWLKEAEEDDSSEEEDDDMQIAFSNLGGNKLQVEETVNVKSNSTKETQKSTEEDFDIDAI